MEWENYSMSELTNQALATIKDANHKKLLLSGVQILASLDPDHAAKRNGQGFDATDTHLGHSLARIDDAEKLTALQVVQCNNLCKKYFKQLPTEYWDLDEDEQHFEQEPTQRAPLVDASGTLPAASGQNDVAKVPAPSTTSTLTL